MAFHTKCKIECPCGCKYCPECCDGCPQCNKWATVYLGNSTQGMWKWKLVPR